MTPLGPEQAAARGRGPAAVPGTGPGSGAAVSSLADGERKLVTILFADVAGFTALAETLDPEEVRDLVNSLFGCLVPCVERFGGTVDKFIGDELMALFGAPTIREDDAERAVRAALAMRSEVAKLNSERATDLSVHIGVNTGRVLAGEVGTSAWSQYSVIGDAVNVAARLTQAAGSGEILVGPDTHRLACRFFEVEERGQVPIKGRTAPVVAHRVIRERPQQPRDRRAGAGRISSPLVGREAERTALRRLVERVWSGRGGFVALTGDAGLGKSRLVAEVRREAAVLGVAWLEARALAFDERSSYAPIAEIVRQDAGLDLNDDPAVTLPRLRRRVEALFETERDRARVLPSLATLLAVPIPAGLDGGLRRLNAEGVRRRMTAAVCDYFRRAASERPLVVVLEDVHWLDESSVRMIEQLTPLTRESPLALCVVGRRDTDSATVRLCDSAGRSPGVDCVDIELAPLSVASVHELIRNLIGTRDSPIGLESVIQSRATGNPLFVEEVIRALIDLGGLESDGLGGWRATPRATEIRLPEKIESVILARVDRLEGRLKQVLKAASVIGRVFHYPVLEMLVPEAPRLRDDLAALEALDLVRPGRGHPESEFLFAHALIQEATYQSLLQRRRKELHRVVAETIETLSESHTVGQYSRLAYHWAAAEAWEKAREYLLRAGDQAFGMASDAEAIAHFQGALEAQAALARAHPDSAGRIDPLETAALWRKVAALRVKQRHPAEALSAIGEAEAELECARSDTAQWWDEFVEIGLERAFTLYFSRQEAELSALLDRLGPTVDRWGTPRQKGHYLIRLSYASIVRERFCPTDQTLDYARGAYESVVPSIREEGIGVLGPALVFANRPDEAEPVLLEGVALAREEGDLTLQAVMLAYLGLAERRRGNARKAMELSRRALDAAQEAVVPLYEGVARANISWARWREGDAAGCEQDARDSLVYLATPPMVHPLTWLARWPLIGVLLDRGDTSEAVEHAMAMLEPSQQPMVRELVIALTESIDAWDRGRREEATADLQAAHALAGELGY